MASFLHGYTVGDPLLKLHKAAYKPAQDLVPSTGILSRASGPAVTAVWLGSRFRLQVSGLCFRSGSHLFPVSVAHAA